MLPVPTNFLYAWLLQGYKYSWCVDPLDGTKEFLKRNGQFTVNIALLEDDTPIMGVVQIPVEVSRHHSLAFWIVVNSFAIEHCPSMLVLLPVCSFAHASLCKALLLIRAVQNKVYWACRGQGAFIHENGTDRRIRAASFKLSDPGLRLVGSSSHNSPATQEFISRFQDPSFLQLGSSIKLLKVADGSADLYPRMAPTCEWDTAAAHAVVAEAGGKVIAAGKCDGKGNSLEDWKVRCWTTRKGGGRGRAMLVRTYPPSQAASFGACNGALMVTARCSLPSFLQAAVAANKPVVYNKENNLNPFFVVYGACDLE